MFSAAQKVFCSGKQLARKGMNAPPKSALFDRRLRHERIVIFSNRRGDGLTLKTSIMEKTSPPRKGQGGRPAKDNPAIYRFSVNFSAVEHARFLTMYERSGLLSKSLRRRLSGYKNRPRNAGIRGQTDATARSISGDRSQLQSSRQRIAYPLFRTKSIVAALQAGKSDPATRRDQLTDRRAVGRVQTAVVIRLRSGELSGECYE